MEGLPPADELGLADVAEGEELRVVRTDNRDDPSFVDSFRSHAELALPPRGVEATHPLIYEGISVYESRNAAIETARRYPRIGSHVAELRLTSETGVRYLHWGPRGHLTLWGDPIKLSEATVDTIPVEGGLDGLHDSG